MVWDAYASGMTLRRIARVFRVDRKTVVRKFLYLANLARVTHEKKLEGRKQKVRKVEFDEMETFEHTKLKPIAISVGVVAKTGEIVDLRAETLHYKGPLAALAFRKYGRREDRSALAREAVLKSLANVIEEPGLITSDANPKYPALVAKYLPGVNHRQQLARVVKTDRKNRADLLFTLNYTNAKIRNDLSRMSRKTWVTTKKLNRLQAHLDLYLAWNNGYRLPP